MGRHVARFWREEEGQTLTGYLLLLALVSLLAFGAAKSVASTVSNIFSRATTGFADIHSSIQAGCNHQYDFQLNDFSSKANWNKH